MKCRKCNGSGVALEWRRKGEEPILPISKLLGKNNVVPEYVEIEERMAECSVCNGTGWVEEKRGG